MAYPHPFDLSGQTAVVTGAAGGLGRAMADAMAEAGANVAVLDVNLAAAQAAADAIAAKGVKALAIRCDIASEADVESAFAQVDDAFGRIDILINNAGIGDPEAGRLHDYKTANWDKVVAVNLTGHFFCARAALQRMVPARYGRIVNIASMWGLAGASSVFPLPAYNATKGAMVNLTRELALEYATDGICVNAICPGFFITSLGPYDDPEFVAATTGFTPMGRLADPDEIKGTAIYLASAAASFTTGAILAVDGGCMAK